MGVLCERISTAGLGGWKICIDDLVVGQGSVVVGVQAPNRAAGVIGEAAVCSREFRGKNWLRILGDEFGSDAVVEYINFFGRFPVNLGAAGNYRCARGLVVCCDRDRFPDQVRLNGAGRQSLLCSAGFDLFAVPSIFVFPATISAFFVAGMPEGADGNRWQMGFGGRRPTEGGTRLAPLCGPFLIISHCER